ncbi:MAG: flagellar biosynthesis protein FlhA [Candidatus Melainabacteria bacterium]|jgi:flagellar biosynthesis protein FlhA|nr:flagellar biosynthesis protein FlhA [Candidatus Melainabacteria bacterium]
MMMMMAAPAKNTAFAIPPISELLLGVGILALVLIILVPLPDWFIDFSVSFNISLGIVLLMMSLYVRKPLDIAAYPSLILMATLFRLSLGIASTRAILANGHAGEMIEAFGHFVTGGNLVVGVIIYSIITLVQFMVITKGSERVAEVGARFALDAMPGKQMTIDSDLNAGLIGPDEAKQKREDLQRESALLGSMDGAMKFVKGDSIAGIIITVINIVGGFAIGVLQKGLPLMEALNKYTILTIGDGLTQQLPALLMAVAIGITMTRTTSVSDSLAQDLFAQFQGKPYGLIFAALFLVLIAVTSSFTGLPWWAFTVFALLIGGVAFSVFLTTDVQQQLGELDQVQQNMQQMIDPNRMYERMGVDSLSLQVGANLLQIADPEQDGQLLGKIAGLRTRLTDELGYILPNIRIMDSNTLEAHEYMLSIRGNPVATGRVYPGKFMILASYYQAVQPEPPENVVRDVDPTYNTEAYWLDPNDIPPELQAQAVEATDAVIAHLQEVSIKYVDDIMSKMDVLKLMELMKQSDPSVIQELVPGMLTPNDLRKVFVNLTREKVSIKDIQFIFERLSDYARFSREPDVLSERLRASLGRQICISHADKAKSLVAVTLSNQWEQVLDEACQRTELGTMFLLNPLQVQQLIEAVNDSLRLVQQHYGRVPVILCSPRIRLPLYQLLDRHLPMITVLSYSELIPDVKVQAVDSINMPEGA